MSIIDNLRANPIVVMQRNHFYIGEIDFNIACKGSAVMLEPYLEKYDFDDDMAGHKIHRLNVIYNRGLGYDYYYPFIHNGYGTVFVPDKLLPFRPVCVTMGMNGCALEVRYFAGKGYGFYHDADGKYSQAIAQNDGGTLVCRIEANVYHDDDLAEAVAIKGVRHKIPLTMATYFISVYDGTLWHVFASGVVTNSQTRKVYKVFWPVDKTAHPNERKRYFGIFNAHIPLIKRD